MYKAVIFDVGGVLIENPLPKMLKHYALEFGVQQEDFDKVFFEEFPDWQTGNITEDEFWQRIATKLNTPTPSTNDLWLAGLKSDYKEHEKIIDLANALKSKGIKIAILSDTEKPVARFLEERFKDFDIFVFSCDEGYAKPQKEIFEITLDKLGIKADEAVFIDDREINIEGAEKLGIKSILFDNQSHVISTINSLLV